MKSHFNWKIWHICVCQWIAFANVIKFWLHICCTAYVWFFYTNKYIYIYIIYIYSTHAFTTAVIFRSLWNTSNNSTNFWDFMFTVLSVLFRCHHVHWCCWNRGISQIPPCIRQISHTHVHIYVTKRCSVGYGTGALWDVCNRSINIIESQL